MPDELWELVEPLLPEFRWCPQGGGVSPVDQRVVFKAVVFVLTGGCAWWMLPQVFGGDSADSAWPVHGVDEGGGCTGRSSTSWVQQAGRLVEAVVDGASVPTN
ncbi:transposase [Nocardia aurantia]|uniref:transposase n=1 Tax=Nocardia aurantia TaxID=2585199 RepID=UPI003872EB4A